MNLTQSNWILVGICFLFIYLKYEVLCNKINIEKMSTTNNANESNDISEQITKIYKSDIQSLKDLAIISQKLQEDKGLIIPGNATIKGNVIIDGTFNYLPKGTILTFSNKNIPNGWTVCDGTKNTPDLRGRFLVGTNLVNSDYNKVGKIGGTNNHVLTTAELPIHSHTLKNDGNHRHWFPFHGGDDKRLDYGRYRRDVPGTSSTTSSSGTHIHTGGSAGGNKQHYNIPPYYVLIYIMKL